MNNTVMYSAYGALSRVREHMGDVVLYKHCSLLYYFVFDYQGR